MRSATPPSPLITVVSVRIDKAKLDAFRVIAESNQRSVSAHIRWLVDQALDSSDGQTGAAA
jgi:hypothetical protein